VGGILPVLASNEFHSHQFRSIKLIGIDQKPCRCFSFDSVRCAGCFPRSGYCPKNVTQRFVTVVVKGRTCTWNGVVKKYVMRHAM
jgi:hypothetical protein